MHINGKSIPLNIVSALCGNFCVSPLALVRSGYMHTPTLLPLSFVSTMIKVTNYAVVDKQENFHVKKFVSVLALLGHFVHKAFYYTRYLIKSSSTIVYKSRN